MLNTRGNTIRTNHNPIPTCSNMKTFIKHLVVAATIAGFVPLAQAIPQLKIFDGTTTIIVSDNGGGDSSGTAGRIVWDGSIGNWTLNTDVGTTWPAIGTLSNPRLDLSFNAVSNGLGGTLVITFSADGFGPTNGSVAASIGGVTDGAVSYQTFGGTSNVNFDTSNLLTSQGPFANAFSGAVTGGTISNAGPYSLTERITITHAGSGITTGNALLQVPDSGTSALLLGAGLTGIGLMTRIRRRIA
jgi:hypothetical protein